MVQCPCCSQKSYEQCCKPYLEGETWPDTPERLMRSRYTAYTMARIDYVKQTMRGKVLRQFNEKDAKQWALTAQWQGLEILEAEPVAETDAIGYVSFVARYLDGNDPQALYERSEFVKEEGRWYYVKEHAYQPQAVKPATSDKIGRNDPCPCGSGKKYKKCCA